jgi:hypothetical protein
MARYYVNKNTDNDGNHEVHVETCSWLPNSGNRIYLGDFTSCGPAKQEAKKYYATADGCAHCSSACHTG